MPRRHYDSDLDEEPRRRRRKPRKKSGPNPILILSCIGGGLLVLAIAAAGAHVLLKAKPAKPGLTELDRLEGKWDCTFRNQAGTITMYKIKEIIGTTETATWYRPDGKVYRINRVEFELLERGPNKIFKYFNGWVEDESGVRRRFQSGEYIYTLEGDTWTEYVPGGGTIVWTRMN